MIPKVTVLMPVYNGAEYLHQAIDSVLNQTFSDFEFLIINDGSTDTTEEIILSCDDPRIRYVKNEHNIGLTATLNKGLELASGEYVARVDSDDVMQPQRLELQYEFLKSNPDITVVGSWWGHIDESGKDPGYITKVPLEPFSCALMMYFDGENPVGHPCVMYRKNAIRQIGGYNEEYSHAEDLELWFRCSLNRLEFANIGEPLTLYRVSQAQKSTRFKNLSKTEHHLALMEFIASICGKRVSPEQAALIRSTNLSPAHFEISADFAVMDNLKRLMLRAFFDRYKLTLVQLVACILQIWSHMSRMRGFKFSSRLDISLRRVGLSMAAARMGIDHTVVSKPISLK